MTTLARLLGRAGTRIACLRTDESSGRRRLREWARNVAAGRPDTKETFVPLHLDEGDTIGPAKAVPFPF